MPAAAMPYHRQIHDIIDQRFQLLDYIGGGGMGVVFKAADTKYQGRPVAIKLLLSSISSDHHMQSELLRRFEQEILTTARLGEHPLIVTVLDSGVDQNQPYLVMEYLGDPPLNGVSLGELLRREGALQPERVVHLAKQICVGLHYAHTFEMRLADRDVKGVVHRDVKPSNIFVLQDPILGETIRLLDFGISKAMSDITITMGTQILGFIGTVQYASPEQLRGKTLDPRSDIYSLGIVIYEMLTGEFPYLPDTDSFPGWYQAHNYEPPRRFRDLPLRVELPSSVEELVLACLEKDPQQRPQSMAELGERLQACFPAVSSGFLWSKPSAAITESDPPRQNTTQVDPEMAGLASPEADSSDSIPTNQSPSPTLVWPETPEASPDQWVAQSGPAARLSQPGSNEAAVLPFDPSSTLAAIEPSSDPDPPVPAPPSGKAQTDIVPAQPDPATKLPEDPIDSIKPRTVKPSLAEQAPSNPLLTPPAERDHPSPQPNPSAPPASLETLTQSNPPAPQFDQQRALPDQPKPIHSPKSIPPLDQADQAHRSAASEPAEGSSPPQTPPRSPLPHQQPHNSNPSWTQFGLPPTLTHSRPPQKPIQPQPRALQNADHSTPPLQSPPPQPIDPAIISSAQTSSDSDPDQWKPLETPSLGEPSDPILENDVEVIADQTLEFDLPPHAPDLDWDSDITSELLPDLETLLTVDEEDLSKPDTDTRQADPADPADQTATYQVRPSTQQPASPSSRSAARNPTQTSQQRTRNRSATGGIYRTPTTTRTTQGQRNILINRGTASRNQFWEQIKSLAIAGAAFFDPKLSGTVPLIKTFSGHTGWVLSVAFSPDGQFLATGSEDTSIRIWDLGSGESICTLTGHTAIVTSVAFSPNGRLLASSSDDKTIKIWDLVHGGEVCTLTGHRSRIKSLMFSPLRATFLHRSGLERKSGRQLLASGSHDKTIKIWDLGTEEWIHELTGHESEVTCVTYNSDGLLLASGSADKTAKIWDLGKGELLRTLSGHSAGVWSVAFSPSRGTFVPKLRETRPILATGSEDRTIRLWDLRSGEMLHTFVGHTSRVRAVAFSPDGKNLISGSGDKTIRIWDLQSGDLVSTLTNHTFGVWCVAFSSIEVPSPLTQRSQGYIFASGSGDATAKLWWLPQR